MKATKKEQQEALGRLKGWIQPGDTIYCVLAHCSDSGMRRVIRFCKITNRQQVWDLSWNIARALECGYNDRYSGVVVNGCGMDMGFHVVYSLSDWLFADGYQLKHSWL